MNILMLDLNPEMAARYHCDKHLAPMIIDLARLLSSAWHYLDNDEYKPLEELPETEATTPWLRKHVRLARSGPELHHQANVVGEWSGAWWLLHGQRVYNKVPEDDHPCFVWVRQLGGNYRWAWELAANLTKEYTHRFGRVHPTTPVIWTLEAIPPSLLPTEDQWTEAVPVVSEGSKVIVDGYYDTVASYRRHYAIHVTEPTWTKRPEPDWLQDVLAEVNN